MLVPPQQVLPAAFRRSSALTGGHLSPWLRRCRTHAGADRSGCQRSPALHRVHRRPHFRGLAASRGTCTSHGTALTIGTFGFAQTRRDWDRQRPGGTGCHLMFNRAAVLVVGSASVESVTVGSDYLVTNGAVTAERAAPASSRRPDQGPLAALRRQTEPVARSVGADHARIVPRPATKRFGPPTDRGRAVPLGVRAPSTTRCGGQGADFPNQISLG